MGRNVFLDCGTHEGQGLRELAPCLPADCEIHCFEPNPFVELERDRLAKAAEEAGARLSSLTLHRVAVYDSDGEAQFAAVGGYPRGTSNRRGQSSSIYEVHRRGVPLVDVRCVSLLSFLRSLEMREGDAAYVKLDIEGAEFAALKQLLAEGSDVLPHVKVMWIEWHDRYFDSGKWENQTGVKDLTDALEANGVTVHVWK